jgi:hypothetical protein
VIRGALLAVLCSERGGSDDDPPAGRSGHVLRHRRHRPDRPPLDDGSPSDRAEAAEVEIAAIADDDGAALTPHHWDDGTYSLTFDGISGEPCTSSWSPRARCRHARHARQPATGEWTDPRLGGSESRPARHEPRRADHRRVGKAGAFNIFDTLVGVMDRPGRVRRHQPDAATALWQPGSDDGTYYLDTVQEMHLLGEESDDDGR